MQYSYVILPEKLQMGIFVLSHEVGLFYYVLYTCVSIVFLCRYFYVIFGSLFWFPAHAHVSVVYFICVRVMFV